MISSMMHEQLVLCLCAHRIHRANPDVLRHHGLYGQFEPNGQKVIKVIKVITGRFELDFAAIPSGERIWGIFGGSVGRAAQAWLLWQGTTIFVWVRYFSLSNRVLPRASMGTSLTFFEGEHFLTNETSN